MVLSFQTNKTWSRQTVKTQIRLLLKELSDLGSTLFAIPSASFRCIILWWNFRIILQFFRSSRFFDFLAIFHILTFSWNSFKCRPLQKKKWDPNVTEKIWDSKRFACHETTHFILRLIWTNLSLREITWISIKLISFTSKPMVDFSNILFHMVSTDKWVYQSYRNSTAFR